VKKTASRTNDFEIQTLVDEAMRMQGMSKDELADLLGISRTTLWRKYSHPGEFSLYQIRLLCQMAKSPAEYRGRYI
jgi:DNA-binding phage protein